MKKVIRELCRQAASPHCRQRPAVGWLGLPARGRRHAFREVIALALLSTLAACSVFNYERGTRANQPYVSDAKLTRGSEKVALAELPESRVFVGISLSGGGSRAANFSVAALQELERIGILQHATAISSVSGGSLAAAYYGMYAGDHERWNEGEIRNRFGADLQHKWFRRWFLPQDIARYWFTPFDRSDIMKGVIDEDFFGGRQAAYQEMNNASRLPRILINASDLRGNNFTFTDEGFRENLGSRLDSYPVAHAVMASAAFPGGFNNVTLQNFSTVPQTSYLHLLDGGPTDNLGVRALQRTLAGLHATNGLRGCMMIIVDAHAGIAGASLAAQRKHDKNERDDPRSLIDYFVDTNLRDAFDDLLSNHREDMLRFMGYRGKNIGEHSFWTYRPFRSSDDEQSRLFECHVWHLSFETLAQLDPIVPGAKALGETVNEIETEFYLHRASGGDPVDLQARLFEAANVLVQKDVAALDAAKRHMERLGLAK